MNAVWSALINGAILSALPAGAVWLALCLAPRRTWSASTRYLIWWITLGAALALPALCALTVRSHVSSHVGVPRVSAASRGGAPRIPSVGAASALGTRWEPWTLPLSGRALEIPGGVWQRWLLAIWFVCSALLLLRLARSYVGLVRAGAAAEDAPDGLRRRVPAWCAALGVDPSALRVACSSEIAIPVALGPRCRMILMPVRLLAELSEQELDHVGLHETAHLARRDDIALLAQRAIEAIFYLHPVVRCIARRIDLEREIACDDLAVAATRNPRAYAACLTRMVVLCGGVRESLAAANFAERRQHLSQRVELIMKQTRNPGPQPLASRLIAFVFALCALVGILVNRPAFVAFAAAQAAAPPTAAAQVQAPAPKPAAIQAATPAVAPAPGIYPNPFPDTRLMLLLFDTTSMTSANLSNAASAARKFIERQLQNGDRVAVVIYNGSTLDVRQDFTNDSGRLLQALGNLNAPAGATPSDGAGRLSAIQKAIEMMAPVTGKKALIYFTDGPVPIADASGRRSQVIDAVIAAAIRANVAIFPINAQGLIETPAGRGH